MALLSTFSYLHQYAGVDVGMETRKMLQMGFIFNSPGYSLVGKSSAASEHCHRRVTKCSSGGFQTSRRKFLLQALATLPLAFLPENVRGQTADKDRVYDTKSGSFVPVSSLGSLMYRDLGKAYDRCIVVGEIHDNICTHAAQLAVIDAARRLPDDMPLVVGFEQFYRLHDPYLEQFVNREISLKDLLNKCAWNTTWGFDPKLYVPIFEYCRIHRIPMVGLNVPYEVVREVSRVGFDGLSNIMKAFLPDDIDVGNRAHYNHFTQMMGLDDSHSGIFDDHSALGRYYEAQVLWEEWMSQSVAMSLAKRPASRMIALIGSGHVEGRFGLPDRVQKRCNQRPYTVLTRPVPWTMDEGHAMPDIVGPDKDVADLVWYTRRNIDLV